MSEAAGRLAPMGRLRVAVYAPDRLRHTALSRVVAEAVALCAEAGRPVATPDQAAEILGLAPRQT